MNDAQVRAVELLSEEYDYGWGPLHAHKVADLAMSIFDQMGLQGLLEGFTLDDRRTLLAACYAHDIGASARAHVAPSQLPSWARAFAEPDRHGEMAFLILRSRISSAPSERSISTLTAGELSLLLYCLLWHAASAAYVLDVEPLFDRPKALVLAAILRIADGLDSEHRLRVRDVRIRKASVWLRFLVRSLAPVAEEVESAREKSDMLSQALNLRVFVQEVVND